MTIVSENDFLKRILDVVAKLLSIARAQGSRFQKLWQDLLINFYNNPHKIRATSLDKEKFLIDIDYRIEILKIIELSQIDGFYAIKSILETLYNHYFNSNDFKNEFDVEDQIMIKYITAREILGNLIQYNKMDHETTPMKYNILARNYLLIKLNGQKDIEILENMKKLNIQLPIDVLHKIIDEIVEDGLINKEFDGENYKYTLKKELKLTENGEKKINNIGLQQIISWPTQFWRSYYNIRELNFTVSDNVVHEEFLNQILSKSATQGFGPANYVFKNLIKYFETLKSN